MQKLTDNVYVETGFRGCNTSFVVTSAGTVIIDTPTVPADAQKWRDEAAKHRPIRYVINTEPHSDHASGNYWIGAPVVAHEGTRQELTSSRPEDLIGTLSWMAPDALPLDPQYRYRLPEITFTKDLTLYLGDHTFQLLNLPGHTASETAVYVPEEKIVFTGDNLNLKFPIFVKSFPYEWLNSLKRIQQLDASRVVPGHGEVSDKSCIQPAAEAVQFWIDSVKWALDRNLTVDEVVEKSPLAQRFPMIKDPKMGFMLRNSVIDLYKSLKSA